MTAAECRDKLDAAELLILEVCEALGETEMNQTTVQTLLHLSDAGAGITCALRCTGLRDSTDALSQERHERVHTLFKSALEKFLSGAGDTLEGAT